MTSINERPTAQETETRWRWGILGKLSPLRLLHRHPQPQIPEVPKMPEKDENEVLGEIVKRELLLANITLQWPFNDGIMTSQATIVTRPPPESPPGIRIETHPGSPIRSPVDTNRLTITQQPNGLFQVILPLAETGVKLILSDLSAVVPRVMVLHEDELVQPTDAMIIRQGEQLGNLGKDPLCLSMTYRPQGLTINDEPQLVGSQILLELFPSLNKKP